MDVREGRIVVSENNLRVLMVISQFYPLRGGAEVQAQQLAKGLCKRGINVAVLTRHLKGLPRYELIEGIPVYRVIRTMPLGALWGMCYMVSVFLFLYRKRNEYDIIHCHILQGLHTVIALIFKYLFNKKVVVKMSSSGETSDLKLLREVTLGSLFMRWVKNVDAIISVCKQSSREIVDNGFSRDILVEIPNGVNTQKYCNKTHQDRKKLKTITYVGRLDGYKGVDYLLNGFKTLLSKIDTVRLIIVGTGPDETHLKYLAQELEIQEHVLFKGKQENIAAILDETDIFVLPSLSEGMSNVLLEAMACSLPVVATAVGGNSDLISDRYNGILIPPQDSLSLCEALVELLNDDGLTRALGNAARKTVEDHYSMERITDDYVSLYSQLGS
jgi:glycosyltransferase involved in cell wall biosynthesis